jgi:argininosuccinate lyase
MTAFNESLPYDQALHPADIIGSQAYAQALLKSGILTQHECSELICGLNIIEQEWPQGNFQPQPSDGDIHTANNC